MYSSAFNIVVKNTFLNRRFNFENCYLNYIFNNSAVIKKLLFKKQSLRKELNLIRFHIHLFKTVNLKQCILRI
jgi:hypothetical protein